MVDVKAVFSFVGENPPTALIIGGILFILVGFLFHQVTPGSGGLLILFGIIFIALGVGLHIMWLETR